MINIMSHFKQDSIHKSVPQATWGKSGWQESHRLNPADNIGQISRLTQHHEIILTGKYSPGQGFVSGSKPEGLPLAIQME
jgi:hypothetical protein